MLKDSSEFMTLIRLLVNALMVFASMLCGTIITRGFIGAPLKPYRKLILTSILTTVIFLYVIDTFVPSMKLYSEFLTAFLTGIFSDPIIEKIMASREAVASGPLS